MEIAGDELRTENLDHHGIVASVCRELKLVERINSKIGSNDPRRRIQPGVATMAMIINGLGFTNRRLYLTPQFFESKAVDALFEESITAEQLNDHTLGKALDEIAAYGPTRFFGEIAMDIALEHSLVGKTGHLDTTSFSLSGQYETEEVETIKVTHGFSKDHRPDLKQVILSMICSGPAQLPIWIEPQNGNSSDRKTFHDTVKAVLDYHEGLRSNLDFTWVADSAFYTVEKLQAYKSVNWISRVPESISSCRQLVERSDEAFSWHELGEGYKCCELESNYGEIAQRWCLIFSSKAHERESKTFERKLSKEAEKLRKECWHQSNQLFHCEEDAKSVIEKLQKKNKFFNLGSRVHLVTKHAKRGRPGPDAEKIAIGFQVTFNVTRNEAEVSRHKMRKGRFVLATNELNGEVLPGSAILESYKEQQSVEGGFRFLKDPWFMVDSFFVKKRSRISALMVVMALCLLVYNLAQHKLRTALKEAEESVPNQKGKPTQNPTMRWIFQLMEGISIVKLFDESGKCIRKVLTNLNDSRKKIILLMGGITCQIYGIQPEIAGM